MVLRKNHIYALDKIFLDDANLLRCKMSMHPKTVE